MVYAHVYNETQGTNKRTWQTATLGLSKAQRLIWFEIRYDSRLQTSPDAMQGYKA